MNETAYDAGDETQVKKKKSKSALANERKLVALKNMLDTYEGREWMWEFLTDQCRIYTASFTGNSTTFFNEGARHVGLHLLAQIHEADPNSYSKMRSEALQRETE